MQTELSATERHVGEVGSASALATVILTLDTSAYASGDLLADTQAIPNAVRVPGGRAVLQSLLLVDEDDQGVALTVYVLARMVTMGVENSAPSITDANAFNIQAVIDVGTSDYKDLGGVRVANIRSISAVCEADTGSRDLYVALVNGTGTPTYTANGLKLRLGFLQD